MKILKFLLATLLCVLSSIPIASAASKSVAVKGYFKKNGTYVAPHYRSAPDKSVYNNWSTLGNVNPYTGKAGTKNPDGTPVASHISNETAISPSNVGHQGFIPPVFDATSSSGIYTLYRSSVGASDARIHVATFDAHDGAMYNQGNCEQTQRLFQSQQGITTTFWCEPGIFKASL